MSEHPRTIMMRSNMAYWRCEHNHNSFTHPACYERFVRMPEKVGVLDIESSNLDADFGIVYCWSIKVVGSDELLTDRITKEDIKKGLYDKRIVQSLAEALPQFTKIVGYYSTGFDIPYVRTRALLHGIPFPVYGSIIHVDLYYTVKYKLKLHRNRLEVVTGVLADVLGKLESKTRLDGKTWIKAGIGLEEDALKYIHEHNKIDVNLTEKLYQLLQPHMRQIRRSI